MRQIWAARMVADVSTIRTLAADIPRRGENSEDAVVGGRAHGETVGVA